MSPLDVLLRWPLFAAARPDHVAAWLDRSQSHRFSLGDTVFQEGSPGHWAYLLLEGRMRVLRRLAPGREETLGNVHASELFGEYALLAPGLNTATCRAASDGRLLQFPLDPVRQWVRVTPSVRRSLKNWLQLHFLLRQLRGQAFRGFMSETSALAMLPHLEPLDVAPLRTVQSDGLCADRWLFIERGEVLLSVGEAPARLLEAGACLGESVLYGARALPTATALQPTRCLGLPHDAFLRPQQAPGSREQTYAGEHLEAPARVRWVGQKDANDCGAASLSMIAHYFECPADTEAIRSRLQAGPRGLSLADLLHAARSLSLDGQAVRISPSQLPHVQLPAIAHLTSGHYVVLFTINRDGVQLGDPATGLVNVSLVHFLTQFSGYLLLARKQACSATL